MADLGKLNRVLLCQFMEERPPEGPRTCRLDWEAKKASLEKAVALQPHKVGPLLIWGKGHEKRGHDWICGLQKR